MKPNIDWYEPAKVSSQVVEIGYCAATHTLGVRFKSGGEYHYHDVSRGAFHKFATADSLGKHLGEHIKGSHKFTKIERKQ